MIISKNIFFKDFNSSVKSTKIFNFLKKFVKEDNEIFKSLKITYKDKFKEF